MVSCSFPRHFLLFLLFSILLKRTRSAFILGDEIVVEESGELGRSLLSSTVANIETVMFSIHDGENRIFSPYMIEEALKVAEEGASNGCREKLEHLLSGHEPTLLPAHQHQETPTHTSPIITQQSPLIFNSISEVIVDTSFEGTSAFENFKKRVAAKHPSSVVLTADFNSPQLAAATISRRVENATQGTVKNLVKSENVHLEELILVNALYFKAQWQSPFMPWRNMRAPFYSYTFHGLIPSDALFMRQTLKPGSFVYYHKEVGDDSVTVVGLPYSDGHSYLFLYMPKYLDGFAGRLRSRAFTLSSLAAKAVSESKGNNTRHLSLSLPKVRFTADHDLGRWSNFAPLGSRDCTSYNNDFEGVGGDKPLRLGGLYQGKAFAIDEQGTEAAAATAAPITDDDAVVHHKTTSVTFDRPFFFQLRTRNPLLKTSDYRDDEDVVLFTGKVFHVTLLNLSSF